MCRPGAGAAAAIALACVTGGGFASANQPASPPAAAPAAPDAGTTALAKAPAVAKPAATKSAAARSVPAGPVTPAPQPGALAAEQAHIARYDTAIAAVRSQTVAAEDVTRLQAAFARIGQNDINAARAMRDESADPLVRKLIDWFGLRAGLGSPADYRAFLSANPAWPGRDTMTRRLEEALFTSGGSARAIKEQFKSEPPQTGAGYAALASSALAEGDEATAAQHARTAWRDLDIAATLETGFIERFGRLLTAADHKWRFDRLLMDDPRWSNDRNERAAIARRMLPLLSERERAKAEARLAVFLRGANAATLMAALPSEDTPDWGMTFQHVQFLRRGGRLDEAAKILLAAPTDPKLIVAPDAWWVERRGTAYDALKAANPKLAYELVKTAGQLSVNPLKDQTFLAGWLALDQLRDAKLALQHFEAMRKAADGPLSQSKSAYWLARALEAAGRGNDAQAQYKDAARFVETFHGQLAQAKLLGSAATLHLKLPAAPTAAEIERFAKLDAARAVVIAHKARLDRSVTRAFLIQLQKVAGSEAETGMVAHLAEALGDTQMGVRIAKAGIARGFNLVTFAYPLHAFPAFTALRAPPEIPLLLAIARQESEFNTQTLSGTGARGLLQVMPVTANHVCKDYKLKCDIPRLMTDTSYNTMMAAAYIGDRMHEFRDSYVLGIAGDNAGPGRARQWMREFGDPRDLKVDTIDWIHRIPFEETREYVQKVLSNLQVYRARMASGPSRLMIMEDLARARGTVSGADQAAAATPE